MILIVPSVLMVLLRYVFDDQLIFDLSGHAKVWGPLALYANIQNLFDEQYEEIYGFPSLGRSVIVGVRLATGR